MSLSGEPRRPTTVPALEWVDLVDPAGNESAETLVRDTVWVATMGKKVTNSPVENPHRFHTRARHTPILEHAIVIEAADELRVTAKNQGASGTHDTITVKDLNARTWIKIYRLALNFPQ